MHQWIKIEEKLPDFDTAVLVWDGDSIEIDVLIDSSNSMNIQTDYIWESLFVHDCNKVTHWMPLPEPPNK